MELQTLIEIFQTYGYLAVFGVLLACGFGLPIPEDITLVAGGVISGLGYTDLHTMFYVSMAGVLIGDGTMFALGRIFGVRLLRLRWVSHIVTPARYTQVQEKFEKYGQWVLFIARFTPGLRSPVFVIAGISGRVSYLKFLLIDGFAALISVPIWIYLGYLGAHNIENLVDKIGQFQDYVVWGGLSILVVALLIWFLRVKRRAKLPLAHSTPHLPPDEHKPVAPPLHE